MSNILLKEKLSVIRITTGHGTSDLGIEVFLHPNMSELKAGDLVDVIVIRRKD